MLGRFRFQEGDMEGTYRKRARCCERCGRPRESVDEFDESQGEGLPGAPTIVNALWGEFAGASRQEVHGDGMYELLSASATDAVSKERIGFTHVTHDNWHAERTKGREDRSAECRVGRSYASGDAEHDGRRVEAPDGTANEANKFGGRAGRDPRGLPTPRGETEAVEDALTRAAGMELKREDTRRGRGGCAHSDESSRA